MVKKEKRLWFESIGETSFKSFNGILSVFELEAIEHKPGSILKTASGPIS